MRRAACNARNAHNARNAPSRATSHTPTSARFARDAGLNRGYIGGAFQLVSCLFQLVSITTPRGDSSYWILYTIAAFTAPAPFVAATSEVSVLVPPELVSR